MSASSVFSDEAAREFLLNRINYETANAIPYDSNTMRVDRMRALLARLGDPHTKIPLIHVAGTKGKGSTATMICSAFAAGGKTVGLYSSPHLNCVEERFRMNGKPCSVPRFTELVQAIRPHIEALDQLGTPPTYFEITTAIALWYFATDGADLAVIEVGLGGRLDSTNVIDPVVSVITSISFDHTKQLGSTIEAIAREKGGIIKPHTPIVIGENPPEVIEVLSEIASQRKSPTMICGKDFGYTYLPPKVSPGPIEATRARLHYHQGVAGEGVVLHDIQLAMFGRHQAANAAAAIAAIQCFSQSQTVLPPAAIKRGLATAKCPARVEVVQERPTLLLDAAHNTASIAALIAVVNESFSTCERKVALFATSRDKKAADMLGLLADAFDEVILTKYQSNPRGYETDTLFEIAQQVDWKSSAISSEPTPLAALQKLRQTLGPNDLGCITGSFFLCAELRPTLVG